MCVTYIVNIFIISILQRVLKLLPTHLIKMFTYVQYFDLSQTQINYTA